MECKARGARRVLSVLCSGVLAVSLMPTAAFAQLGGGAVGFAPAAPAENASRTSEDGDGRFETGEILVEYDNAQTVGVARIQSLGAMHAALEREVGLDIVDTVVPASRGTGTVVKAELPEGMGVDEAVACAEAIPGVAYAQPNYRYELIDGWEDENAEAFHAATIREDVVDTVAALIGDDAEGGYSTQALEGVNDKYLDKQYYLGSWEDEHGASALEAWEWARCEGEVTIGVLDTGCAYEHADLKDRVLTDYMWDAWAATNPGTLITNTNELGDNSGHGTHVCGIAAATADNKVGIAGASYNANILPVKVFDDAASNPGAETETLVKAYEYVMDLVDRDKVDNLHLINMSLGGYGEPDTTDDIMLKERIDKARDDYEILTVVAGGNGDRSGNPLQTPCYPSDFDSVLSVTATNSDGANVHWSDYNEYKDISAPGYEIYSTYPGDTIDDVSYFTSLNGTSMASPLVAGCAALLWAAYPGLKATEAYDAIRATANPIDPTTTDYRIPGAETGSPGVIDAQAAVQKVLEDNDGAKRVRMKSCAIAPIGDQVYTGRSVMPSAEVTYTDETGKTVALTEGTDYYLDYRDNKEVGTATAIVVGKGVYIGRNMTEFSIKYDMKAVTMAPAKFEYEFTGAAITPEVRALYRNMALEKDTDFTLDYQNNVAAGEGTIVVTGKGRFMNDAQVTFDIVDSRPDLAYATVGAIATQKFSGKAVTPVPTVTYDGTALVNGRDFTLSYTDNASGGFGVVHVIGKGAYRGEKLALFQIEASQADTGASSAQATATATPATSAAPAKSSKSKAVTVKAPVAKKIAAAKKALTLTWAKAASVTGYQVMVAANKKFTSGKKTVKVKGAKVTRKKVTGLKAKKKYYMKVRAYKTVNGKTYYSSWSGVKSATTKK